MTKETKIQALVTALVNKFEEKVNKVTSWSQTPSNTNYPSEKLVKDSLDSKEDTANKKASWSATTSDDNYPSEKLVKDSLDLKENAANKVSSWSATTDDVHYPTEKLVKDALDSKLEAADLPTKTSDLTNDGDDGEHPFLTAHQSLESTVVTLEKQATAEEGYASTYVLKQGGVAISPKINIDKDKFVQSASLETVGSQASELETANQLSTGDKYIKMVVNTENSETGATTLVIPVNDLVDIYGADEVTITISNGTFSIKANGVDTAHIKDSAITTDKIASQNVTTSKIADKAVTATQIATSLSDTWLTSSDVDSEIESYIEDLTAALSPVSGE